MKTQFSALNNEEIQERIAQLKWNLKRTDFKTLKHAEGQLTDAEWEASNAERQAWRLEIERLEKLIEEQR